MGTPQIPLTAADIRRIAKKFKANSLVGQIKDYCFWCGACGNYIDTKTPEHKPDCKFHLEMLGINDHLEAYVKKERAGGFI